MSISTDQIKHIASLAKLKFTDEELKSFESEFNSILDYISKVTNADVSGISDEEALFPHLEKDKYTDVLQDDAVIDYGADRGDYLQNATDGRNKDGYIVVSKVIDK